MQMMFNLSVDKSLNLVCLNWSSFREKIVRETEVKIFSGLIPFTFSKLKSEEFIKEFLVQKVNKLLQAWFILKGKVKKIRCCPANQLKRFDVQ